MSAVPGSTNRADGKRFQLAVQAALERQGKDKWEALTDVAEKLVQAALNGEGWAIKEIADRIEGKAAQQVNLSGADGEKLTVSLVVNGLSNAGS